MAGMLPGVEAARRRRVHQSNGCSSLGIGSSPSTSSRRSSFSLFSPKSSTSSLHQHRMRKYQDDEKLGQVAREAKERLDEKLRAQTKSFMQRNNNDDSMERRINGRSREEVNNQQLKTEVFRSKKNRGTKRLIGWAKLRWKSGEQEECAVCLDEFKVGDNLLNLPCAHRFHSTCLVPWLHNNAHCPCCRMSILF
ncbi:probable E3 ubiquitin-protein ligase RHY1A [Amaranthus tricolor]|uniref:probable E3 ubiquitin-protein ligase RHY1A n=1 Tax=Amaranthus tricolor TaxID=29722 RepID=UPI00258AE2AD|nr:probable E3 ubiquitin-protein ligase RHY1A [Amaranthus tricolor]